MTSLESSQRVFACAIKQLDQYLPMAPQSTVITIVSKNAPLMPTQFVNRAANHHALCFDDIDLDHDDAGRPWSKAMLAKLNRHAKLFTDADAHAIFEWTKITPKTPYLFVACEAGISRSVAMAMILATYWYHDPLAQLDLMDRHQCSTMANRYEYRLLMAQFRK